MTDRSAPTPAVLLPVVAAALVDEAGRVLVQRRPAGKAHAGLWEFPGGKVEPGEAPEAALVRELSEELGVVVAAGVPVPLAFASEAGEGGHLLLLLYRVDRWDGTPEPAAADALAWHRPIDLAALPMPPADRPLVVALIADCRREVGGPDDDGPLDTDRA